MITTEHTFKAFTRELSQLSGAVGQMGELVQSQLGMVITAITKRDAALAALVDSAEADIHKHEQELSAFSVRMLALRQPVALDLRSIVAALKISVDLERISDYAASVARRVAELNQVTLDAPMETLVAMAELVMEMLGEALEAYRDRDVEHAAKTWQMDDRIDDLYTNLLCTLRSHMVEDSQRVTACTTLLLVARNLERMGDHVTNICEHVHFMVSGTPWQRPEKVSNLVCGESNDCNS